MHSEASSTSEPLNARVVYRHDLTDDLAILHVAPEHGEVPHFTAGQFCTLGLPLYDEHGAAVVRHGKPRLVRRAYSIASSAHERRFIEIYLTLVKGGDLSPRVFDLRVGDGVHLQPRISGKFTLASVPPDRDLVMVATGTGIAPFISMLRTYRGQEEPRWRRFVLIHGVRYAADLGYDQELRRIADEDDTVVYAPIVTREPESSAWQGLRGRVQHALQESNFQELVGSLLAPESCHVFLCGNPAMIDSVSEMLEARGFTPHTPKQHGNLHYERYW